MSVSPPTPPKAVLVLLPETHHACLETLLQSVPDNLSGWSWTSKDAGDLLSKYRNLGLEGPMPEEPLVAFLAYQELPGALEVCAVATHPAFRKQGLAKVLLTHLKVLAQLRGDSHEIWLEVSSKNEAAIAVYQAQGFQVVGERPKYYPDGASALLMTYACGPLGSG